MSIAFSCACGRNLRAGPHLAGKKTKCPGCGAVLTIPAASEEAAPAAPAAAPAPKPRPAPAAAQVTAPPAAAPAASVTCSCGKRIATKPEWAGKTIKCPACENRIKVPAAAVAAAASPIVPAPAAAAAKPAPAKRPAPPPPPVEEDEFGSEGSEGFGANSGDDSGGHETFADDSSEDNNGDEDDNEVALPPRKGKGKPAAAKKGGSKILFFVLVFVLLAAAGGAGLVAFYPEILNPAPSKGIAKNPDGPDAGKKGQPTAPKEMEDPADPPETTKVDNIPVPPTDPDEAPPTKKAEPKKSGLPFEDNPLAPPPPTLPKIDPDDPKDPKEPKDPKGASEKQSVYDYVPGDAISFAAVRVGALLESPSGAKLIETLGPQYEMFAKVFEEHAKIDPKDVRTIVMVGLKVPENAQTAEQAGIFVVDSAKPIDTAAFEKQAESKGELAGKTMWLHKNEKTVLVLLSPTRVMIGPKELVTGALTTKAPKDGPLSASLKEAASSKACVFAAFRMTPELVDLRDKGLGAAGDAAMGTEAIAAAEAGQLTITEDKSLKIALKLKYADPDQAAKAKQSLEELVKKGTEFLDGARDMVKGQPAEKLLPLAESALASVKPAVAGETLTVPLEIDSTIGDLLDTALKMFPSGPALPAPKSNDKE
jgi:hypothetical protein